jgi:hypothetical protein
MNPTSGVLTEAWEHYKAHWKHLLSIAFIVYAAVALISVILTAALDLVGLIIGAVVSIVGLFLLQGALVTAVADIRDGRADLSVEDTFRKAQPFLGRIAGASILAGIGIVLGLLAVIIPGLILLTIWLFIVPVIVLENSSIGDSFGRSRELVRGYGMNVFGVIALTILLIILFDLVLGTILLFLPDELSTFISDVVSGTVTAPFITLTWTLLYFRMLAAKEPATGASGGPPPQTPPPVAPPPQQPPPQQPPPQQPPPSSTPPPDRP